MTDAMTEITLRQEEILIQLAKNVRDLCKLIGINHFTLNTEPDTAYVLGYESYDKDTKEYTGKVYICEKWEDL